MTASIILGIIAILIILEGLFIIFSPKKTKTMIMRIFKDSKNARKLGVWEIILGIILLFLAISLRAS